MREIPWLVNLRPAGQYYMSDLHRAGGLPVVMRRLGDLLATDALTVSGRTVAENVATAECWDDDVVRPVERALGIGQGTAVLRGNLAPDGAVIKQAAASERLMRHRGRAVVFDSIEQLVRDRRPGADLRCPDERYGLRHRDPARRPGGRGRRSARPGPQRGLDQRGRSGAHRDPRGRRGRAGPPRRGARRGARSLPPGDHPRLRPALRRPRAPGRPGCRLRLPRRRLGARPLWRGPAHARRGRARARPRDCGVGMGAARGAAPLAEGRAMSGERFRGIYSIPVTPFTASGEADHDALARVVEFTIAAGAHGLVTPVNVSEFYT